MPLSDTALAGLVAAIMSAGVGVLGYVVNRRQALTAAKSEENKIQLSQLELLKKIRDDGTGELKADIAILKQEFIELRHEFRTQEKELFETKEKLIAAEKAFALSELEKVRMSDELDEMREQLMVVQAALKVSQEGEESWKQAYHDMYFRYEQQTERYQITLMLNEKQSKEIEELRKRVEDLAATYDGGERGR